MREIELIKEWISQVKKSTPRSLYFLNWVLLIAWGTPVLQSGPKKILSAWSYLRTLPCPHLRFRNECPSLLLKLRLCLLARVSCRCTKLHSHWFGLSLAWVEAAAMLIILLSLTSLWSHKPNHFVRVASKTVEKTTGSKKSTNLCKTDVRLSNFLKT